MCLCVCVCGSVWVCGYSGASWTSIVLHPPLYPSLDASPLGLYVVSTGDFHTTSYVSGLSVSVTKTDSSLLELYLRIVLGEEFRVFECRYLLNTPSRSRRFSIYWLDRHCLVLDVDVSNFPYCLFSLVVYQVTWGWDDLRSCPRLVYVHLFRVGIFYTCSLVRFRDKVFQTKDKVQTN